MRGAREDVPDARLAHGALDDLGAEDGPAVGEQPSGRALGAERALEGPAGCAPVGHHAMRSSAMTRLPW